MGKIEIEKLAAIPHLDIENLAGRFLSTTTFHVDGKWTVWVQAGDQLVPIDAWPGEGFYFAKEPEAKTDLFFHFLDFIAQRASFPGIDKPILGIRDDLFNLSTSIAKIKHLHATRKIAGHGVARMVVTEIEYLFALCRGIFDLIQEIALKLWEMIALHEKDVKKKALGKSFADMALKGGEARPVRELQEKYGLPLEWANYYSYHAGFFATVRNFRDNIVHHGSQVQTVYDADNCFLVHKTMRPFDKLNIWRKEEIAENDLVPLMPALGMVIFRTLVACEDFSKMIVSVIGLPPPIVPGMKFFMRGFFDSSFQEALADAGNRAQMAQN